MNKNLIIGGLAGIGILGFLYWISKNAPKATSSAPIVPLLQNNNPPLLKWKEAQSAGDDYMETNLQILVNGEEKVMEYFNNSGELTLADNDLVNVNVMTLAGIEGMAWAKQGTNNLIITDNGKEVFNKAVNTQSDFGHSFLAKKGHVYEVFNYTMPS